MRKKLEVVLGHIRVTEVLRERGKQETRVGTIRIGKYSSRNKNADGTIEVREVYDARGKLLGKTDDCLDSSGNFDDKALKTLFGIKPNEKIRYITHHHYFDDR